jgi:hypothetical protein
MILRILVRPVDSGGLIPFAVVFWRHSMPVVTGCPGSVVVAAR